MIQRVKRPATAVAVDAVRPTTKQIEVGVLVIPKAFIDANKTMTWRAFQVRFMGEAVGVKHIDQDNRLRVPLKRAIKTGASTRRPTGPPSVGKDNGAERAAQSTVSGQETLSGFS
jgi:hypothetical protein